MHLFEDYLILIIAICLIIVGWIVYGIATRNRGSFAETPDWSKVIRRIIELSCVFLMLILNFIFSFEYPIAVRIILVFLPLLGIALGLSMPKIINWLIKKKKKKDQFKDNLAEHLINAVILVLFFLSALLIVLSTIIKITEYSDIYVYLIIVFDLLMSIEFSFIFYQLYYLIFNNNVPTEEIVQIVKICKELNN